MIVLGLQVDQILATAYCRSRSEDDVDGVCVACVAESLYYASDIPFRFPMFRGEMLSWRIQADVVVFASTWSR